MTSLVLAALLWAQAQPQSPCTIDESGRAWVAELVDTWRAVAREALRVNPDPLPLIVLFDETCAWRVEKSITGTPHGGSVPLPDGRAIPARLTAFAGTYGSAADPFLVMAMPSIWRAEPRHRDDPGLPLLLRAVFVHEMAHTLQARELGAWLDAVERRLPAEVELDDDVVQTRFEKNLEFRASFSAERSLLYQAVAEENPSVRRALVSTAVSMMETRRARFFTGDAAIFAELEDIFLNMEGLGNWAAYQVVLRQGLDPADARAAIRRDGARWSQDMGLAVFLALDVLLPDWRDRVLTGKPPSIPALLAEAARR